jgi:hypothetical protein
MCCVGQNDDYSWRSTLPIAGRLRELRPIVNRPGARVSRSKRRRLPTAAQDAILPHTISMFDSTLDAPH